MDLDKCELGGTHLSSSDFEKCKVLTTEWKPNLGYAWDELIELKLSGAIS